MGACLADIRPPSLAALDSEQAPSDDARARGRKFLNQAAEKHGLEQWKQYRTTSAEVSDSWYGTLIRMMSPWPEPDVRFNIDFENGKSAVRAEFLSSSDNVGSDGLEGLVWGVQQWKPYRQRKGAQVVEFVDDSDIRFMLPTVQYFISLPFRVIEAPIAVDAGIVNIDGKSYQRVLATWGSIEPNREYDQYIVFIGQDSGLIEKLEYTVREVMPFITGTMHYDDFRDVGGVKVGFKQTVTSSPTDQEVMHRIVLQDLRFGNEVAKDLYPDKSMRASKHP